MRFVTLLVLMLASPAATFAEQLPQLNEDALEWLGNRIYENECNKQSTCLTSWNIGEDFPSLGIGHFIWYQKGQQAPFEETFPDLVYFMTSQEIKVPEWIVNSGIESPWTDREAFLAEMDQPRLTELRQFLLSQQAVQAAFIVQRFYNSVSNLVAGSNTVPASVLETRLQSVAEAASPSGLYALIDYVHFKGTGLSPTERYNNTGWGLLQVLENMDEEQEPLQAFVASARINLENRVENAPAGRNESRWLRGWMNRLDTYLANPYH